MRMNELIFPQVSHLIDSMSVVDSSYLCNLHIRKPPLACTRDRTKKWVETSRI